MAVLRYTALRVLVLAAVAALLWLAGLRGLWLLLIAVLVSGLVSLVLLRRQRDAMSAALFERQQAVRRRLAERAAAEDAAADRGTPPPASRDEPTPSAD